MSVTPEEREKLVDLLMEMRWIAHNTTLMSRIRELVERALETMHIHEELEP